MAYGSDCQPGPLLPSIFVESSRSEQPLPVEDGAVVRLQRPMLKRNSVQRVMFCVNSQQFPIEPAKRIYQRIESMLLGPSLAGWAQGGTYPARRKQSLI
eukprot:1289303-Rhodomonas_salina.2